jgi:hypothetical protein
LRDHPVEIAAECIAHACGFRLLRILGERGGAIDAGGA